VQGGNEIVKPIADIVSQFSTVVATQDWHPPGHISFASHHRVAPFSTVMVRGTEQTVWPDHCVQGSANAALHKDLPLEGVTVILRKGTDVDVDSYSAFRENEKDGQRKSTGLGELLKKRGIHRIYVCGLARDYCVLWSALDAKTEGFEVVVLDDL
jgi:nicotinamidase/pyrazinamidase